MEPNAAIEASKYAMIGEYGIQMTLIFLIAVVIYTIVALRSKVAIFAWYRANGFRFALSLLLFWLISAAIVFVPTFSTLAGSLGLNFDQGTAGVGAFIAGLLIKGQAETNSDPLPVEVVSREENL